jgi:competence protein ComEC
VKGGRGLFAIPLVVAGSAIPLLIPPVPPQAVPVVLVVLVIAFCAFRWHRINTTGLVCFLLPLCWTLHVLDSRDRARLHSAHAGSLVTVTGTINGLPQENQWGLRFQFRPDVSNDTEHPLPDTVLAHWYRDAPVVKAGERWQLRLRLQPPRSRINFSGPDRERWYYAQGLGAVASIVAGDNRKLAPAAGFNIHVIRQQIGARIESVLGQGRAGGMLRGLTVADRNGLSRDDMRVLSTTGTGHLLAISGLHVGLVAAAGFAAGRVMTLLLPGGLRIALSVAAPWCMSLMLATLYAALSGFAVSTRRALIMLLVLAVLKLLRRQASPVRAWLLALAAVLLFDPLAPLRAGFWLSFAAVAVLLLLFTPRGGRPWALKALPMAQLALGLALAPLGLYWFQQTSMAGGLANLIAIPWVSLAVVPAALAAVFSMAFADPLADFLLVLAGIAAEGLWRVLDVFSRLPDTTGFAIPGPGITASALALIAALLLLLPRPLQWRWIGLVALLTLYFPAASRVPEGGLQVTLLDVGQGLSVLVSDHERLLLYDTGPGDGDGADLFASVIRPALVNSGYPNPERVVVSHGDLDHAGGLASVLSAFPSAETLANLREKHPLVRPCSSPQRWQWPATQFEVLHPSPQLPYLGNDSSCVLSIRHGDHTILLSGDISEAVEQRLVGRGLDRHDILLVPHHGSASSSSPGFIEAAEPRIAIVAAGAGNRFGFPRHEVGERYREAGVVLLSTADCGAIRISLGADGEPLLESARVQRPARWRWPAAAVCP